MSERDERAVLVRGDLREIEERLGKVEDQVDRLSDDMVTAATRIIELRKVESRLDRIGRIVLGDDPTPTDSEIEGYGTIRDNSTPTDIAVPEPEETEGMPEPDRKMRAVDGYHDVWMGPTVRALYRRLEAMREYARTVEERVERAHHELHESAFARKEAARRPQVTDAAVYAGLRARRMWLRAGGGPASEGIRRSLEAALPHMTPEAGERDEELKRDLALTARARDSYRGEVERLRERIRELEEERDGWIDKDERIHDLEEENRNLWDHWAKEKERIRELEQNRDKWKRLAGVAAANPPARRPQVTEEARAWLDDWCGDGEECLQPDESYAREIRSALNASGAPRPQVTAEFERQEYAVPGFVDQLLALSSDDRLTDAEQEALAASHSVILTAHMTPEAGEPVVKESSENFNSAGASETEEPSDEGVQGEVYGTTYDNGVVFLRIAVPFGPLWRTKEPVTITRRTPEETDGRE